MNKNAHEIYQNRLKVADLIEKVILGKISVYTAVTNFPKVEDDINIKCAFDALMHREADEDIRNNTEGYGELQDEYLMNISYILKNNQPLPENIISEYIKYHNQNLISSDKNDLKSAINKIKRMINL